MVEMPKLIPYFEEQVKGLGSSSIEPNDYTLYLDNAAILQIYVTIENATCSLTNNSYNISLHLQ